MSCISARGRVWGRDSLISWIYFEPKWNCRSILNNKTKIQTKTKVIKGSQVSTIKVILRKLNLALDCKARFSNSFRSAIWLSESDEMISWWLIASVTTNHVLSIKNSGAQTVLPSTIPFCHSTTKRCLKVDIQHHSSTSYSPWEPTWITLPSFLGVY